MRYVGKQSIFDDLMIGGVLLTPPDPATYSYELMLPDDDGTPGQFLTTDGVGRLSWTTAAGSGITMTNGVDNRVMTATGATAITGEANFLFDYTSAAGYTCLISADPTKAASTGLQINFSGSQSEATHKAYALNMGKSGITGSGDVYDARCIANAITDSATNDANADSYLWGITNHLVHANSTGDTKQIGLYTALDGATTQYGIQQLLTGGTVSTMFGIWQRIDDGATDLYFQSSDTTTVDYFSIKTGVSGATTFTTVDGGATAADLTFDINGDIKMKTDGDVWIYEGSAIKWKFDTGNNQFTSFYDATNYFQIDTDANGVTTFKTNDSDGELGNLILNIDGNIELNADAGEINFKDDTAQLAKISTDGLSFENNTGAGIIFDGATDDAHMTTLSVIDPTGTRAVNLPDASGTVALTSDIPAAIGKATSTALGTVKLEDNAVQTTAANAITTTASRTYGVQLNASDQAVVNVPWTDTDTKVTLNGTTANGVPTYGGVDTLDIESTLTYTAHNLTIGDDGSTTNNILSPNKASAQPGTILNIQNGDTGAGTNMVGGAITFNSGGATGDEAAGTYIFKGGAMGNPAGGTTPSVLRDLFSIASKGGAANSSFCKLHDLNSTRDFFQITTTTGADTYLQNTHGSGVGTPNITIDSAANIVLDSHTGSSIYFREATTGRFQFHMDATPTMEVGGAFDIDCSSDIELNADGGNIDFKDATNHFAKLCCTTSSKGQLDLYGGSSGGRDATGEVNLYEDTGYSTNHITLKPYDIDALGADYEIKLPKNNGTVALTDDHEMGGQFFHIIASMSTKNITSTLNYYTLHNPFQTGLSNIDTSPTTIAYSDVTAALYIAPRVGRISNIKIQGLSASGTGVSDPFKLYIYKAAMSNDATSVSLTLMDSTGSITPTAAGRTWSYTEDWSSGMTFAEDDLIFVWYKKDSNTGAQSISFNINLNGYLKI